MPCRNPDCEQRTMSDDELLVATIQQLKNTAFPSDIVSGMDSVPSCAKCSANRIRRWLIDYKLLRETCNDR